ncbi:MAG TPA: hypothetical protein VG498_06410 [Terriglobales bacterium]|nr:hypothetical protein [Terriglobales bacterium]
MLLELDEDEAFGVVAADELGAAVVELELGVAFVELEVELELALGAVVAF